MKKRLALFLVIILAAFSFVYQQKAQNENHQPAAKQTANLSELKPQSFKAVAFGVSEKVSSFAPAAPDDNSPSRKMGRAEDQTRAVPNKEPYRKLKADAAHDADAALARTSAAAMPAPLLSFNGISNEDNAAAYGFRVIPPDTNGDVGPNHFVQTVNILTRVYDKNGAPLTPPFKLSSIFSALGTVCSTRNDGDPIVLYDALADRWMISQFCNNFPPFRQLIAVSKTSDPTGEFYVYEFIMPNVKFNDYPKLGVWTDGYYMSTDEFLGSDYAGSGAFAFDRKKMLVGDPSASFIYFDLATPSTIRFGGFLPSDLDGITAPPLNAPNTFVGYTATEYGDPADALRLFDFHADFVNPSNSTFAERGDSPLAVAAFDPTSPDGRADIAEPAPGELLDAQSDRLMYRAAYRNFGTHESLVVNQTVRVSPINQTYRGGVRVYELRKTTGAFGIFEQATIGSLDTSRWLGSAAQDYQGNLAVGFSVSNETDKPAISYSGKLASEPSGVFRDETALIKGTGVQTAFGSRWGDYSQMTVDPTDDCTFWLTNEYYTAESQAENQFGWLTRVGKFKFPECASAPRAIVSGVITNAANNQPLIYDAIVTANAVYTRNVDATGSYGNLTLVPGTYTLTAAARGFRSQTVTVTLANGQNLTQNFALQPAALFESASVNITAESCAVNNAVEPSETVTVNVSFNNSGAANTTNLVATLLPIGGVTNPSQPQNYGVVAGSQVSRSFTFTASPNLECGAVINLTLQLQDGADNLGTLTTEIQTGKPRFALTENFGMTGTPNLPAGWTTSATGAQDIWKTSMTFHETPPLAAYSTAAGQVGINEMISPVFRVYSSDARVSFRNRYDLETTFLRNKLYDGAVLEIRIDNGFYQDIIAAGGTFEAGGYDGVIESCCQNLLAGRRAWSGKSGPNQTPQFITSRIKLPARARNKNIRLRWRVGTDNGTSREGQYIDDVSVSDGYTCDCQIAAPTTRAPFDFDGDAKTDLSVYRPSDDQNQPDFYLQNSANDLFTTAAWGSIGDAAVNADYDGDGKTDLAVFRPSDKTWFVLRSSDNSIFPVNFGVTGDKLAPADYDGDGQADIAVYRPSNGTWFIRQTADGQTRSIQFGTAEDLPVQADYDGDNKIDVAVYRPSNGVWYILRSSDNGLSVAQFGQNGDKAIAGDFDGDNKADYTVFRPSNGVWYQLKTVQGLSAVQFGASGDKLLQADFDGDGKRDIGVYRQSTGVWYYIKSSDGAAAARQFGSSGDVPAADDICALIFYERRLITIESKKIMLEIK